MTTKELYTKDMLKKIQIERPLSKRCWSDSCLLQKNPSEMPQPVPLFLYPYSTWGARVWIPHPEKVWESATVTADFRSGILIVQAESGDIKQIKVTDEKSLPPLRNPSLLIGQNDLTSLSYLHEPAVLHNLQVRFCDRNAIYTYCGIVLVAINPYYDLPIYGDETIFAYRGQAMGDLDPHIFAVSEEAYTKLEREKRNQSIIVSGESGAGKTVSAKYAMRYFAAVGGSASETHVERKVLASSPIMEAIGNAKTTRNDNSSRFGKFIEIRFDGSYRISGASMRTYLLEKSRVVYQSAGERNYHALYQLCAASKDLPHLYLEHQDSFQYLNQGGNPTIEGVDDYKAFRETRAALTTLGFSADEQDAMFVVLATVLHLGNVDIYDDDGATIDPEDKHLGYVCSLLEISKPELMRWLTHRRIASAHEVIVSRMDIDRATFARDALAKRIYADLFNWTVRCVNRALETGASAQHFIGVLDIYGFETFEINSFEQFCINYANEKLQQQFNQHVFKLEQDEYVKEGISWTMIDFYDNGPCIQLIESRLGVLALLDEECRVPQGSDAGFASKLHVQCARHEHYATPRFQQSAFIIRHFAAEVEYQAGGFLEKNRDTVSEEQLECVRSTPRAVVAASLAEGDCAAGAHATLPLPQRRRTAPTVPAQSLTQPARRPSGHKQTVGAQFRASLSALMATLSATTPHYVRCIKPNDEKKPFQYDCARAVQQLRACGVLETIRISAAGFPSRWLYQDFFQRYRLLCRSSETDRADVRGTCRRVLERHIKHADKYQFGTTKIFFRAGQVAYLEKIRADLQRLYCVRVQSCVRRFVARRRYLRVLSAVRGVQRYGRGMLARRKAQQIRRRKAAIVIQKHVRGWIERRKYVKLRRLAIGLQARARGTLARRWYTDKRKFRAAITIQRHVRGWLARRRVQSMKRSIVLCQSAVRRLVARRQYKRLRIEARSIDHVKQLNKGLENKIISLQQRLNVALDRNKCIEPLSAQCAELRAKLEILKMLENEVRALKLAVENKDSIIEALKADLTCERDSNSKLLDERREIADKYKTERLEWQYESEKLRAELTSAKEQFEADAVERDKRHEAEKRALLAELETERASRQKLLSEQYDLHERIDTLQRSQPSKEHRRSLSDASSNSQVETVPEDDYGYGSVRSVETNRPALEAVNWSAGAHNGPMPIADAGLVLRMQNRISSLQSELSRTSKRARDLEERVYSRATAGPGNAALDRIKLEELEIDYNKLRQMLDRIKSADSAHINMRLAEELQATQNELDRRRLECVHLKNVFTNQKPWFKQAFENVTVNLKSLASSNYAGSDASIINEDGELAQAFEAQKQITKQLQEELTLEKKFHHESILSYKAEIERLREENEKYQKMLGAGLSQEPKTKSEEFAQNEIVRLVTENLALQERVDKLSESCRRYKNQIRLVANKLNEVGFQDVSTILDETSAVAERINNNTTLDLGPLLRKKEREYLGMFEYKKQDEGIVVRKLITELKPSVAATLLAGLPAYVTFMMLRHMDHVDDEPKMHSLVKAVRAAVKKTLRRRADSLDYNALWFANMLRLLNLLRQYSGDAQYQGANTAKQNAQCLRIFDLSQYRQVMSDTNVWIYQNLIAAAQKLLERLIMPAVLEWEEITGLSAPAGAAAARGPATPPGAAGPARLKAELDLVLETLHAHGVSPPQLVLSVFKQLFYYICAFTLNQLLLRKDLCCWAKGLQIRYNISHLETWIKERLAEHGQKNIEEVLGVLRPITQAVQLLQARKSMADVQSTVDMCRDLTAMQVAKILNMYTPAEEYEIKITREFIQEIQKKMQERAHAATGDKHPQNLMMDLKMVFSVQFPFDPSPIQLEDIELPDVLGLSGVLTKI